MGIDPVGVSDANIHSHNRYAYGNNNPYKFTDPDGNSPIDIGFFAKDVGNLLVQEIVYGAALVNGDDGVASLAMEGMSEGVTDAAISTVGMINPVPGTGSAMKAAAKAEKAVVAVENASSRSRKYTQSQRKALFEKAEGKCEYCGAKLDPKKGSKNSFEADHKDSFKNGGETTMENGAAACRSCNREKSGKSLGTQWTPPNER
jgi:HNH endonuclease